MTEFHHSCWIIPIYKKDDKLKILLLKWRHNHWWFPKWHIEKWESCETTTLREFEEETWIPKNFVELIKDKKFSDEYWFKLNWKTIHKKVDYYIWFLKDWFEKFIKPQEGEIYEIWLFDTEKALEKIEFESIKNILKNALKVLKE